MAGSERGRDQRLILSSRVTMTMGAWEEEQRWGVETLHLELLSWRGPGQAKWRQPDTVVRRAGEQVRLKYSFSVDELLQE